MIIYVVRHGQTDYNVSKRICGVTDVELNETGLNQARLLKEEIKDLDIDVIISSPLSRAYTTAKILAEGKNIEVIIDERMIEQNYGIYEGKSKADKGFLSERIHFACRYQTGESILQLAQRIYNLLDDIILKYKDKNILLVSHGGVIRMINSYFNDLYNDEYGLFEVPNAKIIKYEI